MPIRQRGSALDLVVRGSVALGGESMILVYTGEGKGKTSASVGQAIRAVGQGMRVCFAQFMKSDQRTGEQVFLAQTLHDDFYIGGCGFFRAEAERPQHRLAAQNTLAWARQRVAVCAMLVLDEALYALRAGLLSQQEIESLLDAAAAAGTHVVLSGRGLPAWLEARADTVSSLQEIKHAWRQGIPATRGIEY